MSPAGDGAPEGFVVGVDVGGTKISAARVDISGKILWRRQVGTPAEDGEAVVGALVAASREAAEGGARAIGVGAAGFILFEEGIVMESPNIAWSEVPLREIVSEATGVPAALDNDANAATAGERLAGVARGSDDFIYLTLGTGIGGGACIGGKVYRGHRGTASEFGHMVVEPEGPLCGCGRRGCLETLASGTALAREARRLAGSKPDSLLNSLSGGDPGVITGEMVSEAAARGDPDSLEAYSLISDYLGLGIANLIHAFDPEMVVLGGGMARAGRLLLEGVREAVRRHGVATLISGTTVALSALGGDAGVVGAAALAWEVCGRLP